MITFTVRDGALDAPPILIDAVVLYSEGLPVATISEFSGNSVKDESGVGDYVVISFMDSSDSAYTVDQIILKSGSTIIAESEPVNIIKPANKPINMRLTCQFSGAYKCIFANTVIGVPYATNFRQGVIRLAKLENELHESTTVYSAADTKTVIETYIHGTDQYVPWDVNSSTEESIPGSAHFDNISIVDDYSSTSNQQLVTLSITGTASSGVSHLNVDGYIVGTAVASSPTIVSGAITDTEMVLNGTYIAALYSNSVDVATTETAAAQKLVTSHAVRSYMESKISDLNSVFVHLTGAESISGAKTFADGVASTSYTGTGVQSSTTNWNTSSNYSKLPTVEVVDSALTSLSSDITTAYQTADSGLQSQIDAINAGQNLADIVDTKSDLATLDAQYIDENDKVQVLHDDTLPDGTQGTTTVSTVYSLTEGSSPYPDPRDIAAYNKTGYYWEYIGEYGSDSYTKSESDTLFISKSGLDQTIASTSSTTNAPSTLAVYNTLSSLGSGYVKLSSTSTQTVSSNLTIQHYGNYGSIEIDDLYIQDRTISTKQSDSTISRFILSSSGSDTVSFRASYSGLQFGYLVFVRGTPNHLSLSAGGNDSLCIYATSSSQHNVSGLAVANYSAITPTPPASATDGRLTTVDYVNSLIPSTTNFAQLDSNNTFTGTTNTFTTVSATSYTGTGIYDTYSSSTWDTATNEIPTVSSVKSAISDSSTDILTHASDVNAIGSIGLFVYTEIDSSTGIGVQKLYGEFVNGAYLKPAGISLPTSGQISYKSVQASTALSGKWKLLSVAMKRTATEPCLVMAQKVDSVFS